MKKHNRIPDRPATRSNRKLRAAAFTLICMTVISVVPAFADAGPLETINNLSDFIFSLIKGVGTILVAWGIVQVGLSIQSHDPSQRSQGFLTLAGGIVIFFTKEILELIS